MTTTQQQAALLDEFKPFYPANPSKLHFVFFPAFFLSETCPSLTAALTLTVDSSAWLQSASNLPTSSACKKLTQKRSALSQKRPKQRITHVDKRKQNAKMSGNT
jgi:hypothetical protein